MKKLVFFVLLITFSLFFAITAKAGDLNEILKGKAIVYNGVCWFDKKGVLTFKSDEVKKTERCVIGMELPDQTKHYILILRKDRPYEVLLYDESDKKQKSLWRDPDSMV